MPHRLIIETVLKHRERHPFARVSAVGGSTLGGGRWLLFEEQAIQAIELGRSSFRVLKDGQSIAVEVGCSPAGLKYLKTAMDADSPDTLLGLPDHHSGR